MQYVSDKKPAHQANPYVIVDTAEIEIEGITYTVDKYSRFLTEGGQLIDTFYRRNGELVGDKTIYYRTGNLYQVKPYDINGLKQGKEKTYMNDGGLLCMYTYDNDELNGPATFMNIVGKPVHRYYLKSQDISDELIANGADIANVADEDIAIYYLKT